MLSSPNPTLDPLYLDSDILMLELLMNHGPWALAPAPRPFVMRIAENGAIEEFAYMQPRPVGPRLPLLCHLLDRKGCGCQVCCR